MKNARSKASYWLKITLLERDARGRVLTLRAESSAGALPVRHPADQRWLRFDELIVHASEPGYVFRFHLGGIEVKRDRLTVPARLRNLPADLVAWAVMRGWRSSDLLVVRPRTDGPGDVYHFPAAPKLAAGVAPSRRTAGPALFEPAP